MHASNHSVQPLQLLRPDIIEPEQHSFLKGQMMSFVFKVKTEGDNEDDKGPSQVQPGFQISPEDALSGVHVQNVHDCAEGLPAEICLNPVSVSDLVDMRFTLTGKLTGVSPVTLTAWAAFVEGDGLHVVEQPKKSDMTVSVHLPPPPPPPPPAVPSVKVAVPPRVVPPHIVPPPAVPPVPRPAMPKTGSDPNAAPVP